MKKTKKVKSALLNHELLLLHRWIWNSNRCFYRKLRFELHGIFENPRHFDCRCTLQQIARNCQNLRLNLFTL